MIPRAEKATKKNCNWWNIKLSSWNQQSLNLKQIHNFEIQGNSEEKLVESELSHKISKLSLENIYGDLEPVRDERQVQKTLPLKDEADVLWMFEELLKRKWSTMDELYKLDYV